MVEVIEDPSFKKLDTIGHGFFTSLGGVSEGIYASLNCAYSSLDNLLHVQENRRRVAESFGSPLKTLVTTRNMHGNHVVVVEKPWKDFEWPEADGMVTKTPNIILGSTSADCAIVLFADPKAGVVGIAHAGWRGAKCGIIESTVEKMISIGANCQNIVATISPCIHQESYEVSQSFYQEFLEQSEANAQFFISAKREDHFHFDLPGYVKYRLLQLKLHTVSSEVALDTYLDERRFFSCRRATHKGEPSFGCQLSCIYLKL